MKDGAEDYSTRVFTSRTKHGLRYGEELGEIEEKYIWARCLDGKANKVDVYKFAGSEGYWLISDRKNKVFKPLVGRELISFRKFMRQ
jgi:hypothetical protein